MAKAPSLMELEIKIAEDGFNKGSGKDFTFTAKNKIGSLIIRAVALPGNATRTD